MGSSRHEIQGPYGVPGEHIEGTPYPEKALHAGFAGSSQGEKGYHLLFFHSNAKWKLRLLLMFLVIGISGAFYFWYSRNSNDAAPDSLAGFGYAILGTTFLLLAAILYSIRRRSRNKRALGQLNSALSWHVFFAVSGLALLFMHSFGNFNPRSGTFALYGMIALVVSGFIGRALDHVIPYMIAREVQKALTAQGEDRIETISQQLQAIVAYNSEHLQSRDVGPDLSRPGTNPALLAPSRPGNEAAPLMSPPDSLPSGSARTSGERDFASPAAQSAALSGEPPIYRLQSSQTGSIPSDFEERPLHTPWDLAYISLEATPQELSRMVGQHRLVPDKQSALTRPGALMPGAQEQISSLREVQHAIQRQQCYRYIIRYWRVFHIWLALLTIGLTVWHLIYAAQLLLH